MSINVFVYGTLKRGHYNHCLLKNAKFLGEATLGGEFDMYSLGSFPALVPCDGEESPKIHGEVYEVDEETLRRLDRLEGYEEHGEGFYDRALFGTSLGVDAWVYFMHDVPEDAYYISTGKWE